MQRYRSFAAIAALAVLAGCASAPPHPQGWPQVAPNLWATVSGAGTERYQYSSTPTTGSLSDLASSQAVATAQRFHGAHLISSKPFSACPGEAGLATYSLPQNVVLEIAFAVKNGTAVTVSYWRPKSVGDSQAVVTAMDQTVCWGAL